MAFVKLDTGILRSTLWMDRTAREVFITALLMAEPHQFTAAQRQIAVRTLDYTGYEVPPGWYGFVEAAGVGIVRQAGLQTEEGLAALERLCSPDAESRSRDYEGRRMIRVDGGYLILNFMSYRDRDHGAAERMRQLRARRRVEVGTDTPPASTPVTPNSDDVTANVRRVTPNSDVGRGQRAEAEGISKNPESAHGAPETTDGKPQRQTGHRLPEDFALTAERRKVAQAEHVDPDRTFAKFGDHWRAASGANARKRDWDATWRNWCRTEADRNRGGGPKGAPPVPLTEAERKAAIDAAWERERARARRIGFRPPLRGEALDNYRECIDREIGDLENRRKFGARALEPVADLLKRKAGGS